MSLTAKQRGRIPKREFGLPGREAYPTDTPGRARAALSYASQEEAKGKLSPSAKARVDAMAHKELGDKTGLHKHATAASHGEAAGRLARRAGG